MSRSPETPPEEDLLDLPLGERPELGRPEDREPRRRRDRTVEKGPAPSSRRRSTDGGPLRRDPPTLDRSTRSSRWVLGGVVGFVALGAALFWWTRPEPPRLVAAPPAVDLGPVEVGAPATPVALVLRNEGGRATEIRRLDLMGPTAGEFGIAMTDCPDAVIPPGGSCRVELLATPEGRGERSASLRIETSGRDGLEVPIRVAGALARLEISPRRLDFGSRPVGSVGLPAEVEIRNVGEAPARNLRVRRRGGAADDFLVYRDPCSGADLAAGGACTVRFGFRPNAEGPRETTLRIEAEAAGPPLEGELIGIGSRRPVELESTVQRLDFGSVAVGAASAPSPVELRNVGGGSLEELGARAEPADVFALDPASCGRRIDVGGRCRMEVRFRPRDDGEVEGRLVLADGALEIPLRGRGWTPELRAEPSRLDFGTVILGGSGSGSVELSNTGEGPVAPGSPVVDGADAEAFRLDVAACAERLAPGRSCRVGVEFRPGREGAFSAGVRWPGPGGASAILRGVGRTALLELGRLRLEIGEVPVGRAGGTTAVVVNRSDFEVRLPPSRFIGSRTIRIEEDGCADRKLAPGARCGIRLIFEPQTPGPAGGELVLPAPAQDGRRRIPVAATGS